MSKKYTAKELKSILNSVIENGIFHMVHLEEDIKKLNLKHDGTDNPEDLHKLRLYSLILMIVNDTIHSAHGYAGTMIDKSFLDHYVKNQKRAFDEKMIRPCSCLDCKERGYNEVKESPASSNDGSIGSVSQVRQETTEPEQSGSDSGINT